MNKCGMCGFFGECTHRKETDSAEDCSQYHDDYYVKYNSPRPMGGTCGKVQGR